MGFIFEKEEEICFLSATVHYSNLVNWIDRKRYVGLLKEGEYQYTVNKLKEIRYSINREKLTLNITPLRNFSTNSHKIEDKHNECLTLRPKSKQSYSWYSEKLSQLMFLLAILMQQKVFITKTIFEIRRKNPYNNKISKIKIDHIAQIRNIEEKTTKYHNFEFLFGYSSVSSLFQTILNNWFNIYQKLKPALDLYIDNFLFQRNSIELEFLTYTQSLEAFHRTFYKNNYISQDLYKNYYNLLVNSIPDDAPPELENSLKSRVQYGNELSLRTRLRKLLDSLGPISTQLLSLEKTSFINNVVNTRNYLTHLDKDLLTLKLSFSEMVIANQKLKVLLLILILKKLDIPEKLIIDKINKHYPLSAILQVIEYK